MHCLGDHNYKPLNSWTEISRNYNTGPSPGLQFQIEGAAEEGACGRVCEGAEFQFFLLGPGSSLDMTASLVLSNHSD